MVEISTVDVVVSRYSEDFDLVRYINIDFLRKLCFSLLNCHGIMINLERKCFVFKELATIIIKTYQEGICKDQFEYLSR